MQTIPSPPTSTIMLAVNSALYQSETGMTLGREYGEDPAGNPLQGSWVLRDAEGRYIDHNRYQNDIASKHKLDLR